MLGKLLWFEIRYWIRQPAFYIFAFFLFIIPMAQMADSAGYFRETPVSPGLYTMANSSLGVLSLISRFAVLLYFMVPTFMGGVAFRDYRHRVDSFLYTYPVNSRTYLAAKFFSGWLIVLFMSLLFIAGAICGAHALQTDPGLTLPFSFSTYAEVWLWGMFPNLLMISVLTFTLVWKSRNIYLGFVMILLLSFAQQILGQSIGDGGGLGAWMDPFGHQALQKLVGDWSISDQNNFGLPIEGVFLGNRLLWISLTLTLLVSALWKMPLHSTPWQLFRKKKGSPAQPTPNLNQKIPFNNSRPQKWKQIWQMARFELGMILRSGLFISILLGGILVVIFRQLDQQAPYGSSTLPITWKLLDYPMKTFSMAIIILTFLYAGMLVHRARMVRIDGLIDTSPVQNWQALLSKFLTLTMMQGLLLSIVLVAGIGLQLAQGYHDINLPLYVKGLYLIRGWEFLLWSCVALCVQTLVRNPYLGLFLLLMGHMSTGAMSIIGLEHLVFRYNWTIFYAWSDLDGFGRFMYAVNAYRLYWSFLAVFLMLAAFAWWQRGTELEFGPRWKNAWAIATGKTGPWMLLFLVLFMSMGALLYYDDEVRHPGISREAYRHIRQQSREVFPPLHKLKQPKIISVYAEVDMYPEENRFSAKGKYQLLNKWDAAIDTILVTRALGIPGTYLFSQPAEKIQTDTALVMGGLLALMERWKLNEALLPGDSLRMDFELDLPPAHFMQDQAMVKGNGAILQNNIFPRLGYWGSYQRPGPEDSLALYQSSEALDADWIEFETVVSTTSDQIALAPGTLLNEWEKEGRRYFHYKVPDPIPYQFCYSSGKFEKMEDSWNGIPLTIYHHPRHHHNLPDMMAGMKAALAYQTKWLGPYQHASLKLVEAPLTYGRFGRSMPGLLQFSESLGFVAAVDDDDPGKGNPAFTQVAHEVAHQWWMHQVISAGVRGEGLILESLCQYLSARVLESQYGPEHVEAFLTHERDWYLRGRQGARSQEPPLALVNGQSSIMYAKGSLVFQQLYHFWGEAPLNEAIKAFYEAYRFQGPPYPTSFDLVDTLKTHVPDSLQYLIHDGFERVALYELAIPAANLALTANGEFETRARIQVQKYLGHDPKMPIYEDEETQQTSIDREGSDPLYSLPLDDLIEVGLYDEMGELMAVKRIRVHEITTEITLISSEKPATIRIDPYGVLIERNQKNNVSELAGE